MKASRPPWVVRQAFLLALASLAAGGPAAWGVEFRLAERDKGLTRIVLGEHPGEASRHMAETLRDRLERITGARLPIEDGDGLSGIALGTAGEFPVLRRVMALDSERRFGPADLATRQSYILQSHERGVRIIAASEMGVVYGGWDFLHRLGYRHFFPHAAWEIVPERPTLSIDVNEFEKPDYVGRQVPGLGAAWSECNRMNMRVDSDNPLPYLPARWQNLLVRNHHNWHNIISRFQDEFRAHPEYLGLKTVTVRTYPEAPPVEKLKLEDLLFGEADTDLTLDLMGEKPESLEIALTTRLARASSKLCVSNPGVRELAGRYAMAIVLVANTGTVAADLSISNVTAFVAQENLAPRLVFDITWDDAASHPDGRHDAAWVFFKVMPAGQTAWRHVTLQTAGRNPVGCDKGVGTELDLIVPSDRKGLFIRRRQPGAGRFARRTEGGFLLGGGVLDLSGSLWERTVTVGNERGRAFTGLHGDGELSADGQADTPGWPGPDGEGAGYRGGSWLSTPDDARVSDRYSASQTRAGGDRDEGWRGIRTAPWRDSAFTHLGASGDSRSRPEKGNRDP